MLSLELNMNFHLVLALVEVVAQVLVDQIILHIFALFGYIIYQFLHLMFCIMSSQIMHGAVQDHLELNLRLSSMWR